ELFYGKLLSPKGSVLSALHKGPAREGGIQSVLNKMNKEELKAFQHATGQGYDSAQAVAEGAPPVVKELMDELQRVDDWLINELNTTAQLTGRKGLVAKKNHLMLSRFWRGDYRVPIYSAENNLVAMASGYTPKQAAE